MPSSYVTIASGLPPRQRRSEALRHAGPQHTPHYLMDRAEHDATSQGMTIFFSRRCSASARTWDGPPSIATVEAGVPVEWQRQSIARSNTVARPCLRARSGRCTCASTPRKVAARRPPFSAVRHPSIEVILAKARIHQVVPRGSGVAYCPRDEAWQVTERGR